VLLFCLLLPLTTALAADAGVRMTSTVRVDSRTGRLVRKTVVTPVAVASTAVSPRQIEAKPVDSPGAVLAPKVIHNVDVNEVVERTAKAHEVDPLLVHSVIKAESNYNPAAVSPKGAMGLMQLMPGTARRFGAENTFDVRQNIEAGVKYLKYLQDMFGKNQLALAAYNAGEGAVLRHGNIPPYRETENYVYRVGKFYGEAVRRQRQSPSAASATNSAAAQIPVVEPLRRLEIARDAEGRIVLRTR
jgi:soluble lytic murein transglycosylase-like protein